MFVSEIYDELVEILATTDKAKVFRKLTQAVQVLMDSGHYFHLNQEVDVCTGWDQQTVTLPRGVEVPLAVNVDGSPQYFRGRLFQYSVNKGGMYNPVAWAWDDRGFVSTVMDIRQPSQLVAVAEHAADADLSIRVIGTDGNNRELRTQTLDGVGLDGISVPIHKISDFPFGTILPDPILIETRTSKIDPIVQFRTTEPHQFGVGEDVKITATPDYFGALSVLPTPILEGEEYFVGSTGDQTLRLYRSQVDALAGNNPVVVSNMAECTADCMTLTNSRGVQLYTSVQLGSVPAIALDSPNEITFAPLNSSSYLPFPLLANTTYFAAILDSTNLLIYDNATSAAALDDTYIPLSISSGNFYAYLRKPIAPQTKLTFTQDPGFVNGDSVQAYTANGVLPQPLIKGQAYYVHRISGDTTYGCTLHLNYADSISGDNPINFITNGTGQNSIAKLFAATAYPGIKSNISAPGLSVPTSVSGSGAVVVPLVSGPVTSAQAVAGGSNYTSATCTFSDVGGYGYTSAPVVTLSGGVGSGAQFTATVANGCVTVVNVTSGGSNYSDASPPTVVFTGGYNASTGFPAKGRVVISSAGVITSVILDPYGSGAAATVGISTTAQTVNGIFLTNPGNGYLYPPRITITGNGTGATASCAITTSFVSGYRIDAPGSGYTTPPALYISGGSGTGASAIATIDSRSGSPTYGSVTNVTVVTQGTGYSTPPSVSVQPSTGIFVQFSTTGTLPAPLVQGAAYRVELPASQEGTFTVKNLDFSDINITSAGSGTFYVALSRVFGIGFTNIWEGDFNGVPNGQAIYFGSDYLLPITSPSTSGSVAYYVQRISSKTVKLYTGYSSGVFSGLISVVALGSGQSYYAIRSTAAGAVYQNMLAPYSLDFLKNGTLVTFSVSQPDGELPDPLVAGTRYAVTVSGTKVTLKLLGEPVVFTSLGSGQLFMEMARQAGPVSSTSIVIENSLIENGQQLTFRPSEGDSLPLFLDSSTFYARRNGSNLVQVFDTKQHALNTSSTVGIIDFVTTGNTADSFFYVDSTKMPVLVKSILHVEKPITKGYVSLYAFDYGRSNDMALIGQYHPTETNPKYRRIRIGKPCAWVRMLYRVKAPVVQSLEDYIPVEHQRAVIAAVHAVDLEDKDFMEQAQKYWMAAFNYLRQQNESMDGHAFTPPQINNITYGDGTDPVMF
jgi:hypothetical protein